MFVRFVKCSLKSFNIFGDVAPCVFTGRNHRVQSTRCKVHSALWVLCPSHTITFWPQRCTYVVDTHVSKKLMLISAGCHVVSQCITLLSRCSHAGATLLSSFDTLDKWHWQVFDYVVLHYVSLPPRSSLADTTLSCVVPRIMTRHSVSQRIRNVT